MPSIHSTESGRQTSSHNCPSRISFTSHRDCRPACSIPGSVHEPTIDEGRPESVFDISGDRYQRESSSGGLTRGQRLLPGLSGNRYELGNTPADPIYPKISVVRDPDRTPVMITFPTLEAFALGPKSHASWVGRRFSSMFTTFAVFRASLLASRAKLNTRIFLEIRKLNRCVINSWCRAILRAAECVARSCRYYILSRRMGEECTMTKISTETV